MKKNRSGWMTAGAVPLAVAGLCIMMAGCGGDGIDAGPRWDGDVDPNCATDVIVDADSAVDITGLASLPIDCPVGMTGTTVATEGYLCPTGDTDWYRFTVPEGDDLVRVRLRNTTLLSNVDLEYSIIRGDGTSALPNGNDFDSEGADGVTCVTNNYSVTPGSYFIVVRDFDLGAGEVDSNNPYILDIATAMDPDQNELNNDLSSATPLPTASPGAIAYKADEDWYSFTAGATDIVHLEIMASAVSVVDLRWELFDSAMLPMGNGIATPMMGVPETIDERRGLNGAGTYYIQVTDNGGAMSDLGMTYTITATLETDPDGNEPNGTSATATMLGAPYNGSGVRNLSPPGANPRLFTPGDQDWYYIDINTSSAIIVELTLNSSIPAILSLIQEDTTPCSGSSDGCVHTSETCDTGAQFPFMDCDSFQCDLGTATCIGGGACVGGTNCAFLRVARTGTGIATVQPWNDNARLFVRVAAAMPGTFELSMNYNLTITLRPDPDSGEPDNFHYPNFHESAMILMEDENQELFDLVLGGSLSAARNINTGTTYMGYLAYEGDFDIFRYDHPCLGRDCGMRVEYTSPAGTVDYVYFVYQGSESNGWASWGADTESPGSFNNQGAVNTTHGDDPNECFFADNNHSSAYYLVVRDWNGNDWEYGSPYTIRVTVVEDSGPCPAGGPACGLCCPQACCDMGMVAMGVNSCGAD